MHLPTVDETLQIGAVLIVIAGIFGAFNSGWGGKKSSDESDALTTIEIKDKAITALQTENGELKERIKKDESSFSEEITKARERIAVLENDNKRMNDIIENRNPELEKFISTATKSLESILATNSSVLEAIQKMLKENAK